MKKFTLVELLIVIAIIGVLLTILLPSLSQAREKAMVAVCQSNLSQLGRMCFIYSKDNNGKYPQPGGNANWVYSLDYKTAQYFDIFNSLGGAGDGSGTIYRCPSNNLPSRGRKFVGGHDIWLMDHYSLATHLEAKDWKFRGDFSPAKVTDGEGILMTESVLQMGGETTWASNHADGERAATFTQLKKQPRGYNQCKTDGSVKWYSINSISLGDHKYTNGDYKYFYKED